MKLRFHTVHVSGAIEFSFFICWDNKHIGIYEVSLTLARWCFVLELDTQPERERLIDG